MSADHSSVFEPANISEALHILGECEKLDTPVGLVIIVDSCWNAELLDRVNILRSWRPEEELPIFVACGRCDRADLHAAAGAGVNLSLGDPADWDLLALQIERALAATRRAWQRRTDKENAEDLLEQHRQSHLSQDLWSLDLATRVLRFNENCKELSGYRTEEVGDHLDNWLGLIHPHDLVRLGQALGETDWSKAPEDLNFEFRLRHNSGTWRWVSLRGRLERDYSGSPVRLIGSHTDITKTKTTDAVTGLANRLRFDDRLQTVATQGTDDAVVFLVGIDRHSFLRDSLGQNLADQLLRVVGERLEGVLSLVGSTGRDGMVARLSGEEFGLALDGIETSEQAYAFAEEIQTALAKGIWLDGKEVFISTSAGFALHRRRESQTGLLRDADLLLDAEVALHAALTLGGGRIMEFDASMRASATEKLELDNEMKRAIEHWEFEVFYQPKVSLNHERIIGFEALLRWRHPTRGIIPPSNFIPVAEANGMIIPIGIRTVREACEKIRIWQAEFPSDPPLEVSVNLSVRQFQDRHLIDEIRRILNDTLIPPATLQFEVTESVLVDDPEQALAIVEELRGMGVGLKIDDFGTGYSSLSYLHRLPFDTLKIDRSFISTMGQDHTAFEIVRAIITLAQNLGLQVVAEGVENRNQAEELRSMGCGYAQGYLFAPPLTSDAAHRMLVSQALAGEGGAGPLRHCA